MRIIQLYTIEKLIRNIVKINNALCKYFKRLLICIKYINIFASSFCDKICNVQETDQKTFTDQ